MIVWELLVIAVGAVAVGLAIRRIDPGSLAKRGSRPGTTEGGSLPSGLAEAQRVVAASSRSADVHLRLRPILREIAGVRLIEHGLRLDDDGEAAQRLLGEELWEIVRPGRPRPENAFAPGLAPADLEQLLGRIEGL